MLGGENKSRPLGYTIVEIMIVLAVSGAMFLIAASFISGRAGRTSFTAGVNEMASNVQDVIQQVQSGKYSDAALDCAFTGSSIRISAPAPGAQTQGTNASCVFLGKLMYFSYDPSNRDSSYETFTLAGGREDANGNPFTSPWAAYATVVTPDNSNPTLDLTDRQVVPQNLRVVHVKADGFRYTYGIGFFQNPALNTGGQATNGAETIDMYYVWPRLGNNNELNAKAEISSHASNSLKPATSADICLTDDTRYAEILLGTPNSASASSGNKLVVDVKMDGTTPC